MSSFDPGECVSLARALVAIANPAVRVTYLRHQVLGSAPEQVAELFAFAMESHAEGRGGAAHPVLLQALSLALADSACDAIRTATRAVFEAQGSGLLARALTSEATAEDPETQRLPDFGKGRAVSLGERKSLARGHHRELITRCLRDPHPGVMRILLGNPIVTETDVLRLCARRPASTEVLREVFRNSRFIVRHPIKVALVLNPYTPVDIALQLVPFLQAQEQRRVLAAQDLSDELRAAVRARIAERAPPE